MSSQYIQECVTEFFSKVNKIESALSSFSLGIEGKREKVSSDLACFIQNCRNINKNYIDAMGNGNSAVDKATRDSIDLLQNSLTEWENNIRRNTEGQEFMHRNERHLLTMVFGQVKTGKSTLGNFIAGQKFLDAEFDNEYKHCAHPVFCEEKAGRSGNITTDALGNDWFTEGVVDTTGAIQYFSLSGLRWLDSPGTGALKKDGDTDKFTMEQIVNDYIDYSDLGIFLMNSSEPGLQADLQYIEKMVEKDKDILIVITKSDSIKPKIGPGGKFMGKQLFPKTDEARKNQQEYITKELNDRLKHRSKTEKYNIISISTALANNAIKEQDDELFKDSNLDELMRIIGSMASDDAVKLKEKNPKKNLNSLIDNIVHGYHSKVSGDIEFTGIDEMIASMDMINNLSEQYKRDIKEKTAKITKNVLSDAKHRLCVEAECWSESVNKTGNAIAGDKLASVINNIVSDVLQEELSKEISKVIEGFQAKQVEQLNMQISADIHKESAVLEHKYTEYITVRRSARGLAENVCSFFGKKYYRNKAIERVAQKSIDLGTNVDVFIEKTISDLKNEIPPYVERELLNIAENYFEIQERYAADVKYELIKLRQQVIDSKYKEI